MANLSLHKIKNWSLPVKITAGAGLILILWVGWTVFGGPNAATQEFLELPEATIQIENGEGNTISLEVKMGNRSATLSGVNPDLIENNSLLIKTKYPASAPLEIKGAALPLDVVIFDGEGNLINIYNIDANKEKTIQPETRYQYTLYLPEGILANNNISVANDSKLITSSIN